MTNKLGLISQNLVLYDASARILKAHFLISEEKRARFSKAPA